MKLRVIKYRRWWWTFSSVVILVGIGAMGYSWQHLGAPVRPSLDFVGGTRLQFELDCSQPNSCSQPINPAEVRQVLDQEDLGANTSVQVVDKHGLSLRTRNLTGEERTRLETALSQKLGRFDPKQNQIDSVGPTLGKQLFTSGMLALAVSFVGIVAYLSFRFQLDYAIFAILALFHDLLITIGIYSLIGIFQVDTEADSLFIVALLTITGFSVTDTVVIYDRIREVMHLDPGRPIDDIVEEAVNSTLTRSINTTATVLLTLVSILLFGGETLHNFALTLTIGFSIGAYSSIFIASTLLAWWRERQEKQLLADSAQ